MTAATNILVTLEPTKDPETVVTTIRTIRGVAGVKLVFGDVRAAPVQNLSRPFLDMQGEQPPEPAVLPDDIIQATAEQFRTTAEALLAVDRHKHIAEARHVAMYLCKTQLPSWSYPELGRVFRRDHTTVMASVDKIRSLVLVGNRHVVATVEAIVKRLPKLFEDSPKVSEENAVT